jgi:hypothetical protein
LLKVHTKTEKNDPWPTQIWKSKKCYNASCELFYDNCGRGVSYKSYSEFLVKLLGTSTSRMV